MRIAILLATLVVSTSSFAAGKSCEELMKEITAKIEANGVKKYTLDLIDTSDAEGKNVVGSCDQGNKKIIYTRK